MVDLTFCFSGPMHGFLSSNLAGAAGWRMPGPHCPIGFPFKARFDVYLILKVLGSTAGLYISIYA
jgi:hypothetical protein